MAARSATKTFGWALGEAKLGEAKSGEAKSGEAKSGEASPGDHFGTVHALICTVLSDTSL